MEVERTAGSFAPLCAGATPYVMVGDTFAPHHIKHLDPVGSHASGHAGVDDELGREIADKRICSEGCIDLPYAACGGYDVMAA